MFNEMDPEHRDKLLASVAERDPRLAEEIEKQIFVFENLARLQVGQLQILLREISVSELALALRSTTDSVKKAVFANISTRTGKLLQDEIDSQEPRRQADVTAAQARILQTAKRLGQEKKISLDLKK